MELIDLLCSLSESTGVSGHESDIRNIVESAFSPLCDEVKQDSLGNVFAFKKGDQKTAGKDRIKIMLAAHMDEIGLMVTKIEKTGFIRFTQVGGIDPRTLPGQQVMVHASVGNLPGIIGVKSPHLTKPEERKEAYLMEDLFIDIGFTPEKIKEMVTVGDLATIERKFMRLAGKSVTGKAMDDRAGIVSLFMCLQELKHLRHEADVFAVATVQEEVGTRGAVTSAYGLTPDIGIAVDVTHGSFPGVPEYETSKMGKGTVIVVGPNIHPKLGEFMIEIAKKYNIPYQIEPASGPTGTDARAIQITRAGIATGLISLPIRYMHTSVELLDLNDVYASGQLMARVISEVNAEFREDLKCY